MTTEPIRVGSLFSGYEGIGLGLRAVFPNAEVAFVADIDDGACKILAHRCPVCGEKHTNLARHRAFDHADLPVTD